MRNTILSTQSLRLALALFVCSAGWLPTAIAQPNENAADDRITSPPAIPALPLSNDIMRGTGKWIGNINLTDSADRSMPTTAAPAATSPSMQFKLAEPGWLGALDTVGQIAASVRFIQSDVGVSGKAYQPAPRVNSPVPPRN